MKRGSEVYFRMKKLLALLLLPFLAGCKPAQKPEPAPLQSLTYSLRGKVMGTNLSTGEVVIDHDAIPGFMEAMTMPYKLADPSPAALGELHAGDVITARLLVEKDQDGEFHHPRIDNIVVVAQARPDYKPMTDYNIPRIGQDVPDFKLVNQSGKQIQLEQYRGKALLITFIYTRCPFSDFCPKMSRNFAQINTELQKDAKLYDQTHLLSISFDPKYDTPAVLRSYGGAYTGKYTQEKFQHWEFAAPKQDELAEMEKFFNVGVTPGDDKTLNHSLSTILIDRSGHIAGWYPGGDWKPLDVVTDIRKAAGMSS